MKIIPQHIILTILTLTLL